MSGILVLAEHDGGVFRKTAAELVAKAASLGASLGLEVSVGAIGDAPVGALGAYGAQRAVRVSGDFGAYSTLQTAGAVAAMIDAVGASIVLAPASYAGKDALPRVAARLGAGFVADCTDLRADGGALVARRPMYSGKAYVDARVSAPIGIFTVRPNSFGAPAGGGAEVAVAEVAFAAVADPITVVESRVPESQAVDLTEADRIVSGGRSLGSKERFDEVIRPLGAALGATVGASRAAVDAHYAPHGEQVGQTGKTVNPQLYVAVGISGAIQHLAGMRTSRVIVAINKDATAPIMEHAAYAIVGDLFEVVPALVEALKEA
jgi:electron transfer flavoprotein alpha subunit